MLTQLTLDQVAQVVRQEVTDWGLETVPTDWTFVELSDGSYLTLFTEDCGPWHGDHTEIAGLVTADGFEYVDDEFTCSDIEDEFQTVSYHEYTMV